MEGGIDKESIKKEMERKMGEGKHVLGGQIMRKQYRKKKGGIFVTGRLLHQNIGKT